ncbi:TetR/AcrR family transcriptional regulator [Radiobacillus deserti]|uniref:TetR/AcrR family transcriptional regulator n=1 Tax=Radiobacillus deserti TaxID=2594883 RepID=A0A516KEZ7_9BACI|nr:TetR-like C-terminal domain-containing protein [Radiobacillus deserti]QDP39969.1 TetR/AcrR family transcriptional regulator [Radiobacillus deserti]
MAPKHRITLKDILNISIDIADKNGLSDITLANVSKRLGIRSPSLYNHINGLSGLKIELAYQGTKGLYDEMAGAAIGKTGKDAIYSISYAYIGFARNNPGLYEAISLAVKVDSAKVQDQADKILKLMITLLKTFPLPEELLIHHVRMLRAFLHGFVTIERDGGFGIPLDINESLQIGLDTIITGMLGNEKI